MGSSISKTPDTLLDAKNIRHALFASKLQLYAIKIHPS
jgi:hypothetical protein